MMHNYSMQSHQRMSRTGCRLHLSQILTISLPVYISPGCLDVPCVMILKLCEMADNVSLFIALQSV